MSKQKSTSATLPPLFSSTAVLPKPALDFSAACIAVERFLISNPHHINSTVGVLVAEIAFAEGMDANVYHGLTRPREVLVEATPYILSFNVIGAARRHVCHNSTALYEAHPELILAYRGRYSTKPPRQAWKASARRARNAADRCNTVKTQYNLKQFPEVDLNQLDGNKWITLTADDIAKMF